MEREIQVEISLNGLRVKNNPLFCEGDTNTHFLNINFLEDLELTGYTLQVFYLPPYPSVVPLIDMFENLKSKMLIPIPNRVLLRNGKIKVEFGLSKDEEVITINKTFEFEVKKTLNSTSLTAYPEGELKKTIAQQIEEIKLLLSQSQEKIDEYNKNVEEKTTAFNNNSAEKLEAYNENDTSKTSTYNQNAEEKLNAYNENDVSKTNTYNQNANEKLGAYNDNDTSKTTAFNENAKNKTTEFDTHVKDTVDKTYLEMDKKATEYANAAGERANKAVIEQGNIALRAIREEGSGQVGAVGNAGSTAVKNIINSKNTAIQEVTDEGTKQKGIVENEGVKQAKLVTDAGTEEVGKVQTAREEAVGDVNANKTANIQAVTDEGTKQIGLVKTEGEKQVGLVGDKGAEQTKLVTDEGAKQITEVGNKGTEETGKVGAEGKKQVGAIQNQGTLSLETILRVQKEIEALLKNQEAIGNALALNGKSGTEYDKEIFNVAGGNFDPEILYLNDVGTKQKDYLYYDRLKPGVFRCLQTTTGTVNSTSNFVDISSLENANRLDNLTGNLTTLEGTVNTIDTAYKEEDKKINSQINKIENVLQDFRLKKYGVKFTGSNPIGVRTFDAVGMVANVGVDSEEVQNDFDNVSFYNRPVCCGTFDENGKFTINAYEGEPGFARDGSNGDVYYECTPFYWNGSYEEPVVSAEEFEGSILAPMFTSSTEKVYLPCYWASLDSNGKYRSISGAYPEWNSLNGHMKKCKSTNVNAHTETIKAHMCEYVLQLVEFATKDLQTIMTGSCSLIWEDKDHVATLETTNHTYVIVAKDKAKDYIIGQTIVVSGDWSKPRTVTRIEDHDGTNSAIHFDNQEPWTVVVGKKISSFPYKTGSTDHVKASSGSAVSNTDMKHQCKWRGKEAPWADGFSGLCDILRKIEDDGKHYPYWLPDPKKYQDGSLTSDYIKLGYTVQETNGYAKTLGVDKRYPFAAITNEVGASSVTYLSAYYYTNTNQLTVAFVGGSWYIWRNCSPVYFNLNSAPSDSDVDRLARLFVTAV